MALEKENTNGSMTDNRKPRNRPTQTQSTDLWQSSKGNSTWQKTGFSTNSAKTGPSTCQKKKKKKKKKKKRNLDTDLYLSQKLAQHGSET